MCLQRTQNLAKKTFAARFQVTCAAAPATPRCTRRSKLQSMQKNAAYRWLVIGHKGGGVVPHISRGSSANAKRGCVRLFLANARICLCQRRGSQNEDSVCRMAILRFEN